MAALMPPAVKKSGGALNWLVVVGHQPLVDRVLRDAEVVVQRAFHAGEVLVGHHRRQDVAAGGQLDAVALGLQVGDL
jgi:hypothetical protein